MDVPESQRMKTADRLLDGMAEETGDLEREGHTLGRFDISGYDEDSWPVEPYAG